MGRIMQVAGTNEGGQRLQGIVQIRQRRMERTNRYLEVDSESECLVLETETK
jgi:hypothetical protein